MLVAVGLVAVLAWKALKPINDKTGFNRKLLIKELEIMKAVDKPQNVLDFAGFTNHHLYFKTKNPAKVYITDSDLQNDNYIELNIPINRKIASRFSCIVDSPAVYVLAGNLPGILKTQPGDSCKSYQFPNAIFTRTALISPNSFALRMFEGTDQIFAKGNPSTGELLKEKNISEKNKDAGISTDGALFYDRQSNLLAFVQYYKNEIICLDTNLNFVKKIKTIDINSRSSIKAAEIKKEGVITSLTPKRLLNASASIHNGLLFINSKIKGDNETKEAFTNNFSIDIYDIKNSLYKGSFYIPVYKNDQMTNFLITANSIVVIYKKYLVTYKLPL